MVPTVGVVVVTGVVVIRIAVVVVIRLVRHARVVIRRLVAAVFVVLFVYLIWRSMSGTILGRRLKSVFALQWARS